MRKVYHITLVLLILSILSVILASCKGTTQKEDDKEGITVATESVTEKMRETSALSETTEESVSSEIVTEKESDKEEIEEIDVTDDFEVELEENQSVGGF